MAWRSQERASTLLLRRQALYTYTIFTSFNPVPKTSVHQHACLQLHEGFGVPRTARTAAWSVITLTEVGMEPGQSAAYVTGCSFLSDCICESTAP